MGQRRPLRLPRINCYFGRGPTLKFEAFPRLLLLENSRTLRVDSF